MATADVVVIGGGCMGASIAFQLARREIGKIILVERSTVGAGPTAKTTGIIRLHYSHEPLIRLAARSLELFTRFEELTGGTADFVRTGFLLLASAAQVGAVAANVQLQETLGVRARMLTPRDIAAIDSRLSLDDIGGAAYESDSGYADGYAATAAFAHAARRLGVQIWERVPAESVLLTGGRVRGVRTMGGVISAGTVLVAAGPWTGPLLTPLGINVPIRTTRHQIVQLILPPAFGRFGIVLRDTSLGFYARPETGGTVLLGSLEDEPEEIVPPNEFNPGVDFDFMERMSEVWRRRYPTAENALIRGGYASVYDCTPDWQPVLGAVDGIAGLYIAAGFSGHGFKLSPALGEVMADLVAGDTSAVDISMFRLARFAAGELARSRHSQGILG